MLNQVVQITIGKDGKVRVEYSGYAGDACYQAGDALKIRLAQLGIQLQDPQVEPKAEAGALLSAELSQPDTLVQEE